jgi:cob(I)alamin adenosyltransferase
MSKLYTNTGDDGYTGLLGEGRVPKYHPRIEAVGVLDEASTALGLARAFSQTAENADILLEAQRTLYKIMAEVSATPETVSSFRSITPEIVSKLEGQIDALGAGIDIPREFIIPGDSQAGASIARARTIVRRAERYVARLYHDHEIDNGEILRYLNRLSSLCFVLELIEDQSTGRNKPTLAKQE